MAIQKTSWNAYEVIHVIYILKCLLDKVFEFRFSIGKGEGHGINYSVDCNIKMEERLLWDRKHVYVSCNLREERKAQKFLKKSSLRNMHRNDFKYISPDI